VNVMLTVDRMNISLLVVIFFIDEVGGLFLGQRFEPGLTG